jgi:hypothetical protein
MRVFISWSGERSKAVATALRQWLPDIIQSVKPWVSGMDIQAGARWSREVEEQLRETQFGIICLTKDNQSAPWLLFEAGALAKSITGSFVCPYLIDLAPSELLAGPLTLFQAKQANKEDTRDILMALNDAAPEAERLPKDQVSRTFERWWPDLQRTIDSLPPPTRAIDKRTSSDMIEEILTTTRQLDRRVTETLSVVSRMGVHTDDADEPVHHIRFSGAPTALEQLISDVRSGLFGGQVLQQQKYSENLIAVNLRSDGTVHLSNLLNRAAELDVKAEVTFIGA